MILLFHRWNYGKKCSKPLNSDCQVLHTIKDHNEHLPNMGWVERADSHLKLIYQKKRNQLEVAPLKNLFFPSCFEIGHEQFLWIQQRN